MRLRILPTAASAWLLLLAPASRAAGDEAWITLLDGASPATLQGWNRLGVDNWRVEQGAVVADRLSVRDSNYLITRKAYGDFLLQAEVWVDAQGHTGLLFRGLDPFRIHARNSYDLNIEAQAAEPGFGAGAIVNFAAVQRPVVVAGQWNTIALSARGTHIVVAVNGVTTVDMIDSTFQAGPIAIKYGGGVVKWRKVLIRPL
jgi:hypothetical protein